MQAIIILIVFLTAFFPAYFGYNQNVQWIGLLMTMIFWLSCYIPFVRSFRKKGVVWLVLLGLCGYTIESLGILTCFPYGCFEYSDQLGPKLFGLVPWMLFFTRPPLVIGVWGLIEQHGARIAGPAFWKYWIRRVLKWHCWGLLLVLVDLVLDPIAVRMGLWSYPEWGFWFGVPLSNFAGWMLSGTVGIAILNLLIWSRDPNIREKKPQSYAMGLWLFLAFFLGYLVFVRLID